jgi:hypothetical protein
MESRKEEKGVAMCWHKRRRQTKWRLKEKKVKRKENKWKNRSRKIDLLKWR